MNSRRITRPLFIAFRDRMCRTPLQPKARLIYSQVQEYLLLRRQVSQGQIGYQEVSHEISET